MESAKAKERRTESTVAKVRRAESAVAKERRAESAPRVTAATADSTMHGAAFRAEPMGHSSLVALLASGESETRRGPYDPRRGRNRQLDRPARDGRAERSLQVLVGVLGPAPRRGLVAQVQLGPGLRSRDAEPAYGSAE